LLIQVGELSLLIDKQIVEENYDKLAVDYSLEKGFIITTDDLTFTHRKIVTRRPVLKMLEETETHCKKAQ
jgi:hypothetical protein